MKVDLRTGDLFKDDGTRLKRLHCPLGPDALARNVTARNRDQHRFCRSCESTIYDTVFMSDDDIEDLLINEPKACLSLSLDQDNCTVQYIPVKLIS